MTCRQLRPYIVDFARGASDAIAVEPQISRHLRGCLDCRALLERERILSAALRRAAGDVLVPAATVERERALLAQFDRVSVPDHGGLRLTRWRWAPAGRGRA